MWIPLTACVHLRTLVDDRLLSKRWNDLSYSLAFFVYRLKLIIMFWKCVLQLLLFLLGSNHKLRIIQTMRYSYSRRIKWDRSLLEGVEGSPISLISELLTDFRDNSWLYLRNLRLLLWMNFLFCFGSPYLWLKLLLPRLWKVRCDHIDRYWFWFNQFLISWS